MSESPTQAKGELVGGNHDGTSFKQERIILRPRNASTLKRDPPVRIESPHRAQGKGEGTFYAGVIT